MILDVLADSSRKRVEAAKEKISMKTMEKLACSALEKTKIKGLSFEQSLSSPGISFICEVKRASPSKGLIAPEFPYVEIAKDFQAAGADAISVLTEPEYFLGNNSYLTGISHEVDLPLLRKDFTVDPYQIYEAKVIGASAVLLICALLDPKALKEGIELCSSLGLSALVEAHDEDEIHSALWAGARIIGVNNRNLKTFEVDFNNSLRLRSMVPSEVLFVAESGIKTEADIRLLREAGVHGVLIGESLMRSPDKKEIINGLKRASQ
ncbi:indole-3-glycerol phosphate synthase TrpC [Lacrimispora saccharolytica]|uniref:Indole-3-glycerol phosphate synthase n=1 Tax=Lacrimispora saccharolytica (strain ATCC 35040 / DSM 2544 / NRCC 2533 / WM1) TaxID=610130 RepID=D9RAU9_LACSW|nr:indole-3-glycerol phosphate synthase TrpC [Lacrimispora saccharolytica]ADL06146.1 Indole-3-glycerol-phosphate synthase [[Clostridium] saccharolyticum WM1]QRV19742.1 indole-3-glycerol phosphate synthase TrpC [Lacrimispora saccharolytica]